MLLNSWMINLKSQLQFLWRIRSAQPRRRKGGVLRSAASHVEILEQRALMTAAPALQVSTPMYGGMAIERPHGAYDLQPTAFYDPTSTLDANANGIPDHLYTMAWLGQYQAGQADKGPQNLPVGDRIQMSFSEDGTHWGPAQVVLKGSGGTNGAISADDHLIGSPSIIKTNGKYYMFYEAYSTWATPIDRFYSFQRGDNWITGELDLPVAGNSEGYAFERNLGFASLFAKAGAHPIYSGEVVYHLSSGPKVNRYLSKSAPAVGEMNGGTWSARQGGQPVFWLYDDPAPGRRPIYSFFDPVHSNTYATDDRNGEGVPQAILVETLGFAASALDSPDMIGADQNRIMMATSTDGVNWTRFEGPAHGGAVIASQLESVNTFNPQTWTINRSYGSGYPSALIRDGYLELYFTDDAPGALFTSRRIRMPVSDMESAAAWTAARAPGSASLSQFASAGSDIKWSPLQNRYFISYVKSDTPQLAPNDPNFHQWSTIRWSDENPDAATPPTFPDQNEVVLPNGGRVAIWGGILSDANGHTIDRSGSDPRTDLDVFFESMPVGGNLPFDTDLAHASVTVRGNGGGGPAVSVDGISDGQIAVIDFGTLGQGTVPGTKSFTVRNNGTVPLTLSGLTVPAGYTITDPLLGSLLPGATDTFTVRLETDTAGTFAGQIQFTTNDPARSPFNFPVTGSVKAATAMTSNAAVDGIVDGQAAAINFGTIAKGGTSSDITFTVRNSGKATLTLGSIILPKGYSLVEGLKTSLDAGKSDTFTVRLASTSLGTFSGQISFQTNDPDRNPFNFPITGKVSALPIIVVDGIVNGLTTPADLGTVVQGGAPLKHTFTVRNRGTAPLTLGTVSLPAGYTLVEGLSPSLAAGGSDTFTVQLNTAAAGAFAGEIRFGTNDPGATQFHFAVTGKITAGPVIVVDGVTDGQATVIDLGTVDFGTTTPTKTFTVRNVGALPLNLGAVVLPAGFSLVEGLSSTLAAGGSDSFTIRLNTSASGSFSGDLKFTTNDVNRNPFNFAIKGRVNAVPMISVDGVTDGQAAAVSFGTSAQDATAPTKTFTVRNTGSAALTLGAVSLPSGFSLVEGLTRSIAAGQSDTFTVKMNTSSLGHFSGSISFTSNASGHSPFNFPIDGTVIKVSSRYGAVNSWQMVSSQGSTLVLKQVTVPGASGNNLRLFGDFLSPNGSSILADVSIGDFSIFGNQVTPMITTLSSGNYVIAWKNTNASLQGGIHYAIYTRNGSSAQSGDRIANITFSSSLTLTSVIGDASTGGFTIFWRNTSTSKNWKRTFNLTGIGTSGEVPA